eukprot:364367-Lingulodinium_polyedra.AAC.1
MLLEGLQHWCSEVGNTVNVASAFSGCDVTIKTLEVLEQLYMEKYNVPLTFRHVWSCESDTAKQKFLAMQLQPGLLFGDFGTVSGTTAYDSISQSDKLIPYATVLFAGFPCTSKSPINNSRAAHATCVQDGTSATGRGFQFILNYIDGFWPRLLLLENVPQLDEHGEADYVRKELQRRGYWCRQ